MSVDYWKSTLKNVAILKAKEKTPESLGEYYQIKAKAVFKVGISIGIASLIIGISSHFIPDLFVIAEATLLFGLVTCLLSLVPKSLAKQILKQAPDYLTPNGVLVCEVGNSMVSLIEQYPDVPFEWVELKNGGLGVFAISREDLVKYHNSF